MSKPYCGYKANVPKGKHLGTFDECYKKRQIRRYGIIQVSQKQLDKIGEMVTKMPKKEIVKVAKDVEKKITKTKRKLQKATAYKEVPLKKRHAKERILAQKAERKVANENDEELEDLQFDLKNAIWNINRLQKVLNQHEKELKSKETHKNDEGIILLNIDSAKKEMQRYLKQKIEAEKQINKKTQY